MRRVRTQRDDRRGLTLVEVLIAVAILGILLGGLIPAFVSNMRINTDSEVRSQAVTAAQSVLDALRADGSWPEYGLDPDGEATIPPVRQVESGGRTFDVQIDYGPYCDASGTCLDGAQNVELEVRWRGRVYYTVETVYTDLR